jgi:hypothetical protein
MKAVLSFETQITTKSETRRHFPNDFLCSTNILCINVAVMRREIAVGCPHAGPSLGRLDNLTQSGPALMGDSRIKIYKNGPF